MNYCYNCGKKLLDGANFCDNCGAKVGNFAEMPKETVNTTVSVQAAPVVTQAVAAAPQAIPVTATVPKSSKSKGLMALFIVLGVVVLLVATVLSILFVPRNLKMGSFKKVDAASIILRYGLPNDMEYGDTLEDTDFIYEGKVKFYGIPVEKLVINMHDENFTLFFDEDDTEKVEQKIRHYCDYDRNVFNAWYKYNYKDLEITTSDGYGYVSIDY